MRLPPWSPVVLRQAVRVTNVPDEAQRRTIYKHHNKSHGAISKIHAFVDVRTRPGRHCCTRRPVWIQSPEPTTYQTGTSHAKQAPSRDHRLRNIAPQDTTAKLGRHSAIQHGIGLAWRGSRAAVELSRSEGRPDTIKTSSRFTQISPSLPSHVTDSVLVLAVPVMGVVVVLVRSAAEVVVATVVAAH